MYKTINKMVPEYLSTKFTPINSVHEHNLRGSDCKIFVPRSLTEALKKSFTYTEELSFGIAYLWKLLVPHQLHNLNIL